MMNEKQVEKPILIEPTDLSTQALNGIIDNFVLREGTDYGLVEISYDKKIEQVKKQIDRGDILIVFDQRSETVTLMNKRDYIK